MRRLSAHTRDLGFQVILLLSGLLILAGVHRYRAEPRRNLVRQTEVELRAEGERLVRLIHTGRYHGPRQLESLFEERRRESQLQISWIQLRDPSGQIQVRAGLPVQSDIIGTPAQSGIAKRQQLSVVDHPAGAVVIERFPVRWPVAVGSPSFDTVANRATFATRGGAGVIEIAARLSQIGTGSRARRRVNLARRVDLVACLPHLWPNIVFSSVPLNESNS